jgi:hypothetical protein
VNTVIFSALAKIKVSYWPSLVALGSAGRIIITVIAYASSPGIPHRSSRAMTQPPLSPPPTQLSSCQKEESQELQLKISSISDLKRLSQPEILSLIPNPKTVKFNAMNIPSQQLQPCLPPSISVDSPAILFKQFLPDSLWETVIENTNLYAERQRFDSLHIERGRPWKPVSFSEIMIFIASLIYMGAHPAKSIDIYWRTNKLPRHLPPNYISLIRFEQIKRYLHISRPTGQMFGVYPLQPHALDRELSQEDELKYDVDYIGDIWWFKVDPMISEFRSACERLCYPSSSISLDEAMIRCFGRSKHTFKMPGKPIKQGYKVFAVGDHGYIYTFTPASRAASLVEVVKQKDLTITGSMVLNLLCRLPSKTYTVYLDNYFTSVNLFKILRDRGIGACGTTRARNKDIPPLIQYLKEKDLKLPWNTLCAIPKDDVLCFAWQDNNIVIGLTTVHTVNQAEDLVKRQRRRPGEKSTSASTTRPVFGDKPTKILPIPTIIDDYNHFMGGVDIANQLCAEYRIQRPTYRSWWPLFYWILDTAIVNAYKIQCEVFEQQGLPKKSQFDFREQLYEELFDQYSTPPPTAPPTKKRKRRASDIDLPTCRTDASRDHTPILKRQNARCTWCLYSNLRSGGKASKAYNTAWRCLSCEAPLCPGKSGRSCWKEFHDFSH